MVKGLPVIKRAEIALKRQQNKKIKTIARQLGVNRLTAIKWGKRGSVNNLTDKERSGRPRSTTDSQNGAIVKKASSGNRRKSVRGIASEFKESGSMFVSKSTIHRRLQEAGLKQLLPLKRPLLTDQHIKKRKMFASTNKNRDWSGVVFHDEKKFILGPPKKRVWRKVGEIYIESQVKHALSINAHAAFGSHGEGNIVLFDESLTGSKLRDILEESVLPVVDHMVGHPAGEGFESMHDNDPKYKSRSVQGFLNENNIVDIGQPPSSPDSNPIENLFGILSTNVQKKKAKLKRDS
jgi:transposase